MGVVTMIIGGVLIVLALMLLVFAVLVGEVSLLAFPVFVAGGLVLWGGLIARNMERWKRIK